MVHCTQSVHSASALLVQWLDKVTPEVTVQSLCGDGAVIFVRASVRLTTHVSLRRPQDCDATRDSASTTIERSVWILTAVRM